MVKMTNEEIQKEAMKAEHEYEMLKDRVHDLYDENKELKELIDKIKKIIDNEKITGIEAKLLIKDLLEV